MRPIHKWLLKLWRIGKLSKTCYIITGAAGFIGSRLVSSLCARGHEVIAIDRNTTLAKTNFPANVECISASLPGGLDRLYNTLHTLDVREKVLIHLAGISHAGLCQQKPMRAFDANVTLTQHLLEFCRTSDISRFVFPSTGLVYGDRIKGAARETDNLTPSNMYAASKFAAEILVRAYSNHFGINATIVRPSNVYGPNSHKDTLINIILKQIENGSVVALRALKPVRDFIYIDDVIDGITRLVELPALNGCLVVNLSTGKGISVRDLVNLAGNRVGKSKLAIREIGAACTEHSNLVLNNKLLIKLTDWQPKYELTAGLDKILEFQKINEAVN